MRHEKRADFRDPILDPKNGALLGAASERSANRHEEHSKCDRVRQHLCCEMLNKKKILNDKPHPGVLTSSAAGARRS